jgi:hypothetical protein
MCLVVTITANSKNTVKFRSKKKKYIPCNSNPLLKAHIIYIRQWTVSGEQY